MAALAGARAAAAAIRAAAASSASGGGPGSAAASGGGGRGFSTFSGKTLKETAWEFPRGAAGGGPGSAVSARGGGVREFSTFGKLKTYPETLNETAWEFPRGAAGGGPGSAVAARGGGVREFSTLFGKWAKKETALESPRGSKPTELELELKFEKGMGELRQDIDSKFSALKEEQCKLASRVDTAELKLKIYDEKQAAFAESWKDKISLVQFNVWKTVVGISMGGVGTYLTYARIKHLPATARPRLNEPRDWFE